MVEFDPPTDRFISEGLVEVVVQYLSSECESLVFESAWIITNITYASEPKYTMVVVRANGIFYLCRLLNHPAPEVREQVTWALGNIASEAFFLRDRILGYGTMALIVRNALNGGSNSMIKNCAWTLVNLCRGKPSPPWANVSHALMLLPYLMQSRDIEVQIDSLWTLSYLSQIESKERDTIQEIINTGVCSYVVQFLEHPSFHVRTPALRVVGNIVSATNYQTDYILNLNVLSKFRTLLKCDKVGLQKETCWALSNILAGYDKQIQMVIEGGIIPDLVRIVLSSNDHETQKEAAWALANSTSKATLDQILTLSKLGTLDALCSVLDREDASLVVSVIDGIDCLLAKGKDHMDEFGDNVHIKRIEVVGGLGKILRLQNHANPAISDKASEVIDKYFSQQHSGDDSIVLDQDEIENVVFDI